jgi:acetyl esterase
VNCQLDPEIASYLDAQKLLPPRSGLSLQQTRERMVESARLYGGEVLDVPRIEDFTLGAGIPVREYCAGEAILVYFHGGRFISGSLDSHDRLCRRLALAARCRLLAVDYRLAPEHRFPAALDDALAAVDWAVQQGEGVAVAGDSAGANLATAVAAARRTRVRCQVLIYPMIDATRSLPSHVEFAKGCGPSSLDMKRGWDEYVPPGMDPRMPRISPFFANDDEDIPPAFVLTAECDCLRDEGELYAHRLGQLGNRVELKRYPGAIHGFITLAGISRLAREAIEDAGAYLRRFSYLGT